MSLLAPGRTPSKFGRLLLPRARASPRRAGASRDPANRRAGDPREQRSATAESHCWIGLGPAFSNHRFGAPANCCAPRGKAGVGPAATTPSVLRTSNRRRRTIGGAVLVSRRAVVESAAPLDGTAQPPPQGPGGPAPNRSR